MKAGGRPPGLPPGLAGGDDAPGRDAAGAGPGAEDEARFAGLLRMPAAGAAVLAGMGVGPARPAADEAAAAARLVEAVAERLLVSDEGAGGGGGGPAVRLLAKDVGLPGLEVVVRREAGGLVVELLAEHPADLALLRGGATELAQRLEARFGTRAEIRVRRHGPGPGPGPEPGLEPGSRRRTGDVEG